MQQIIGEGMVVVSPWASLDLQSSRGNGGKGIRVRIRRGEVRFLIANLSLRDQREIGDE
jgi:hypothetical protein